MKILKGNLVSAPSLGRLEIVEHGCLVLDDGGSILSVEKAAPTNAAWITPIILITRIITD